MDLKPKNLKKKKLAKRLCCSPICRKSLRYLQETPADKAYHTTVAFQPPQKEAEENRSEHVDRHTDDIYGQGLTYSIDETPPWYLCLALGFQHYLAEFSTTVTYPLLLYPSFCMDRDMVGVSELIGTIFFVGGLVTLLQTTLGVRLPILQGGSASFLPPTLAIMALPRWHCDYVDARSSSPTVNLSSLPESGSDEHREIWQQRLREIQGAIMVASLFEVIIGFTGLIGLLLRFIGPLSITPTITLIGLGLFKLAAAKAASQWWIALMTIFLIVLFSQYLGNVKLPCCSLEKGKCSVKKLAVFSLFPVLLAMIIAWLICLILTVTDALPNNEKQWGYKARTDTNADVLYKSKWFRFPYPGQWGLPTVSVAAVFGMLAAVISSTIESVGDYYACARLAGAPPPPTHAVNRGIGVEGIGCVLAGAWGTGTGTTSYSSNIGVICISKVGSRRVVQVAGILMITLGCFGKFGALFATIPEPVIGGMFIIMFGMVTAVGLSNLQFVDMNSSRNIFILGTSIFFGLSFPVWLSANKDIDTGSDVVDQILTVLLSTNMFVGGLVGFVLDNTIPGTDEERGLMKWRHLDTKGSSIQTEALKTYEIPLIQKYLDKWALCQYLPFCPNFSFKFSSDCMCCRSKIKITDNKTGDMRESHSTDADQGISTISKESYEKGNNTYLWTDYPVASEKI